MAGTLGHWVQTDQQPHHRRRYRQVSARDCAAPRILDMGHRFIARRLQGTGRVFVWFCHGRSLRPMMEAYRRFQGVDKSGAWTPVCVVKSAAISYAASRKGSDCSDFTPLTPSCPRVGVRCCGRSRGRGPLAGAALASLDGILRPEILA